MSTLLTPAPELRSAMTVNVNEEVSPEATDGRFEGKTTPSGGNHGRQIEQPWWTLAAKCLALRMTYEEAASFCQISPNAIAFAIKSPTFQLRLRESLNAAATPLESLFRDAGVEAFYKIKALMQDDTTPKPTQLACAKEIIERNLGKAPQTIKHEDVDVVGDPVAMVEHLKQQNAGLRQQLPN